VKFLAIYSYTKRQLEEELIGRDCIFWKLIVASWLIGWGWRELQIPRLSTVCAL